MRTTADAYYASQTRLTVPANQLLQILPAEEYARLTPFLTRVPMRFKDVLQKQGMPISHVYFPSGGALSLIKNMNDGQVAEIATIGNEGVAGAQAFFSETESVGETIVQVPRVYGGDAGRTKAHRHARRGKPIAGGIDWVPTWVGNHPGPGRPGGGLLRVL
jgi:hypothetical protein